MKLSDYVIDFLVKKGIHHAFLVSGGAVIHLVDSAAKQPQMQIFCSQHEQHAGTAADGYARISENLGLAMVTSGPGGTNLVTSVCNAFFDSIPAVYLTGQVATFRLKPSKKLRQKGFQETDVVSIFQSITKYAKQILIATDIKYELEKAIHLATSGRPGPVVLDIPDDLQRVDIDPNQLRGFRVPTVQSKASTKNKFKKVIDWIKSSKRPMVIMGAGIRVSKTMEGAMEFLRYFHLPVVLTWGGMDIMDYNDELNMGGLGVCGPRAGNFAVQNADLIVAMGTRLSQMITGGKQSLFAPKARKVMIDCDHFELNKFTANDFKLDLAVEADIRDFIKSAKIFYKTPFPDQFKQWRERIKGWAEAYPVCPPDFYKRPDRVNGCVFIRELSKLLSKEHVIVADTGANIAWTMQSFQVKKGQRIISAWNHSPMGFSLPGAVGAVLAHQKEVICIIGDGGLMMCLEELATVKRYNLPIKIFIMNNHGHGIQRQTIDTWLNSHYVAVDEATGLSFPDFVKTGEAFGIPTFTILNHSQINVALSKILQQPGPVLCNVEIITDQRIVPMLKFGAGLEDLDPKLPKEEIISIMKVSAK